MSDKLNSVVEALEHGRAVQPITVRAFLDWFGAQRRGVHVVSYIRNELEHVGVETDPDFESAWIDSPISFRLKAQSGSADENCTGEQVQDASDSVAINSEESSAPGWVTRDPTYRISKLEAANAGVISITPDQSIEKAVTLMLANDFSQIPVMTTDREVKGLISWRSIGSKLALGFRTEFVRDATEQAHEVSETASIFDAVPLIYQYGHVLVRSLTKVVTGIVTASDLTLQFRLLTEPFLVLSEIENLVRNLIGSAGFTLEQLEEVREPGATKRKIENVSDLTFGDYVRFLESPERWGRLRINIDRTLFCNYLDDVRKIRNDVMHFDPDGITHEDLSRLRNFAEFLKRLEALRS